MITAIIQARMNSSRLPGKVLLEVEGKALLSYMIERLKRSSSLDQIVLATSDESSDDPVAKFAKDCGLKLFRGSLNDVLTRYYKAAKHFSATAVVRLTGDCPLVDPTIIDAMIERFNKSKVDYLANSAPPPGTFPDGFDVEVFSFAALKRAHQEAKLPSEREHVTFYLWKSGKFSTELFKNNVDYSDYRFTIDYPVDLEVFRTIAKDFYGKNPDFSMDQLIKFIDEHPELKEMQKDLTRNAGWESAYQKDESFQMESP